MFLSLLCCFFSFTHGHATHTSTDVTLSKHFCEKCGARKMLVDNQPDPKTKVTAANKLDPKTAYCPNCDPQLKSIIILSFVSFIICASNDSPPSHTCTHTEQNRHAQMYGDGHSRRGGFRGRGRGGFRGGSRGGFRGRH